MSIIRTFIAVIFVTYSFSSQAGPISEAFSGEVFGIPWGASLEQIKQKFPEGEEVNSSGIRGYFANDDRTIFGLERAGKRIAFTLDADGQFHEVGIEFPLITSVDFTMRTEKLQTLFGRAYGPYDVIQGLKYEWPEDDGLKLTARGQFGVFGIGGGTYVTVRKTLMKKPLDKSKLGL